jgi:hypothetical protein
MTATMLEPAALCAVAPGAEAATDNLGALLAPVHARWLDQVRRNVLPACSSRAGFWPRWGAVRYLADQFGQDYRLEAELVEAVIGTLDVRVAGRLVSDREALETLWNDLDRIGRRRGTGTTTAAIAGAFLLTLTRWCGELERALSSIPLEELPPQAAALAERLRRAHGLTGGLARAGARSGRAAAPGPVHS